MAILIDLQKVSLQGADRILLENLDLTISSGDRIGVVGINGVGKTTLLKIIAGTLKPDSGEIRRGRGIHVGFLEQIPTLPIGTVRETLGSGWEVDAALDRLGMLSAAGIETSQLSGGQLKRVALARVFSQPNDVLILDEPTNHLDLNAIQWLEQQIISFRGAVILVSHDRFLLDQVTTRMVEIDRGKTFLHAGGYSRLLEAQAEREERAASTEQVRRNLAKTELAWLRRGVKARSTKPQARIDAAKRLLAGRPEAAARAGALDLSLETPRLGTMVLKAHHVAFSYDGERLILHGVDLDLGPGDRVGIVGPNGSGKSTFVNLLARRLEPTSGTVKRGPTVVTSYLDQGGGDFNLESTVQELVAGPQGVPGSPGDVALMKRFWFTGALPTTKAKDLSGGERRRLQLLLALADRPNVLLLDEPTNDLDLETIRLVEEFLSQWPGTLIVVSHDRTFLSRTTDRLLEVHEDGRVADVPGGIDAWIARAAGFTTTSLSDDSTSVPLGRQIRDAEKDMSRLERRRKNLTDKILTSHEHGEQTRLGHELADVQKALAVAEEYWLTLVD
ncbi:MAG TPA: ABC-F family ATP-binding cassette domain-containing protein [Acidimicrobiales bacterium]|nr:ABC-F family ATP-binding cassette domain-containing protein [Acidimicrobiales bacterium]